MIQVTELFNPSKPYARFYADASGQIAQVHTRPIAGLGFGRAGWRITASCTDETGSTLTDADGYQILKGPDGSNYSHQVIVQADAPVDILALLEEARQMMAQKACLAYEVWQAAQSIPETAFPLQPPVQPIYVPPVFEAPPEPPIAPSE